MHARHWTATHIDLVSSRALLVSSYVSDETTGVLQDPLSGPELRATGRSLNPRLVSGGSATGLRAVVSRPSRQSRVQIMQLSDLGTY
jgi:hypothetical protein